MKVAKAGAGQARGQGASGAGAERVGEEGRELMGPCSPCALSRGAAGSNLQG